MNDLIDQLIETAKTQDKESVQQVVNQILLENQPKPSANPLSFKILEQMYAAINGLREKVIEGENNKLREYLNTHNFNLGQWADGLNDVLNEQLDKTQIIDGIKHVQSQIDSAKLNKCNLDSLVGVQLLDELQDLTDKLSLSIQPPISDLD